MKRNADTSAGGARTSIKTGIYQICQLSQNQSLVKNWFWIVLLIFYIAYFVSYMYTDIIYTTFSSINFWNSLFAGKVWDFHNFSGNSLYSSSVFPGMVDNPMAIYPLPLYLIFAVWDLPLWIADRFFGVDVFASFWCLLWIKLMLLLFLAITVKALYMLCRAVKLRSEYIMPTVFLFLSSYTVMSPILAATQYDVIMLPFLLFGLVEYFKGNKKRWYFYFIIAITLKLFALFAIIPVLMLKEKRLTRLLLRGLFLCLPTVLFYVFIAITTKNGAADTMDVSNNMIIKMLFGGRLDFGFAQLFLFPAAFVAICIFCYVKTLPDDGVFPILAVYVVAAAFSAFFLFSLAHPYWAIMLAPFITILVFAESKRIKWNLLLYFCIHAGLAVWQGMVYYWCYDTSCVSRMLPAFLFPLPPGTDLVLSVKSVYIRLFDQNLLPGLSYTLFAVCLVAFLLLNRQSRPGIVDSQETNPKELSVLLSLNAALSIGVVAVPLCLYMYIYMFR